MDAAEVLSQEFFAAPKLPTSTHEEWLLRLCAQLMHREAAFVSVMDEQAQRSRARPRKWRPRTRSSND
jgi:hypothetical protein